MQILSLVAYAKNREGDSNVQGKTTDKKPQFTRMNATEAKLCLYSYSKQIVLVQTVVLYITTCPRTRSVSGLDRDKEKSKQFRYL